MVVVVGVGVDVTVVWSEWGVVGAEETLSVCVVLALLSAVDGEDADVAGVSVARDPVGELPGLVRVVVWLGMLDRVVVAGGVVSVLCTVGDEAMVLVVAAGMLEAG